MLFVLYSAIAVLSLAVFFYLVVYPFVCMIECGISKQHSGGTKAVWIVATFLTGVLGAVAYTFIGMQSPRLRKMAISGMVVGACSLAVCIGIGFTSPDIAKQAFSFPADSQTDFGASTGQQSSFEQTLEEAGVGVAQFDNTIEQFEDTVDALKEVTQETIDQNWTKLDPGQVADYWAGEEPVDEQTPQGQFTSRSGIEQADTPNTTLHSQAGKSESQSLASILETTGKQQQTVEQPLSKKDKATRGTGVAAKPTAKPKNEASAIINRYTNRGYANPGSHTAGAVSRYGSQSPSGTSVSPPAPIRNRYTNQ